MFYGHGITNILKLDWREVNLIGVEKTLPDYCIIWKKYFVGI